MLKLGTQTGSLVNHMYSNVTGAPQPEVGMGATMLSWSDRYPATIVEVFTKGKTIYVGVTEDDAKRIDNNGISEAQEYEFTPCPDGYVTYYRNSGKGWEGCYRNPETGRFVKGNGSILIGHKGKFHDFSF